MSFAAKSHSESSTTGMLQLADSQPSSSGQVIYREFNVPATRPLPGSIALESIVQDLESEPEMATRLMQARRNLALHLEPESTSFRSLRLAAGFSQAKLAGRAGATQSYIARVEAGTVDPGTDMVARLAESLGVSAIAVFSAIRSQRG